MNNLDRYSDEQLLAFAKKRMPVYRKALVSAMSFLKGLFGNGFRATAGDVVVDIGSKGEGIKRGGAVSVRKFKAPNFKTLRKHVSALEESDTIDELEYIIDRLSRNSTASIRNEAKKLSPIRDALVEAYNTSFEALENIADQHIPSEVSLFVTAANKALEDILTAYVGKPQDVEPTILVGSEADRIDFCMYYDVSDHVKDSLWVVLTCSLIPVNGEYTLESHLNYTDRFSAPLSYDIGQKVDKVANLMPAIRDMMAIHGMNAVVGAIKLKIDATRLTKGLQRLPFVTDVKISDKAVNVWVRFNKNTVAQEKEIFAMIASDTDVKRQLGRSKRLVSEFTDDHHWRFSIVSRG